MENARRLGLPDTTRPAANRRPSAERPANEPPALTRYLDHAGRAVNAAVNAIAEPVAMAVDLGMAGVGAAYTATTGKPADMPFISFASQDVADGATAADLLNGMNPVYGLMVTAHEIGRAISFNDTGALAEIGGALIGGIGWRSQRLPDTGTWTPEHAHMEHRRQCCQHIAEKPLAHAACSWPQKMQLV